MDWRRQCSRLVPHIKCQRKGSVRKISNERMTLNCVRSVFNGSGALTRCVISSSLILIASKTKYSQQKRRTTAAKSQTKDWLNEQLSNRHHLQFETFSISFFFHPLMARGRTGVCQLFRWHRSSCDSSHPGTIWHRVKPGNSLNMSCATEVFHLTNGIFVAGFSLEPENSVPRSVQCVRVCQIGIRWCHTGRNETRPKEKCRNLLNFEMIMRQTSDTLSDP